MEQLTLNGAGLALNDLYSMLGMTNDFLGVEVQLIIPVIVIVGLLNTFLRLRKRFPVFKNSLIVLITFVLGMIIEICLGNHDSVRDVIRDGLMLGSLSAMTYQFVKPFVFKLAQQTIPWLGDTVVVWLKQKVNNKLGISKERIGGDDE